MQMFRATCRKCGWTFDVVALPLPLTLAVRAMENTCCPMCTNCVDNTIGAQRALTDAERAHKAKLEVQRLATEINLCPPQSTSVQEQDQ